MTERLQRYLDGDLPGSALSAEERAEAEAWEAILSEVGPASTDDLPDLTGAVMARLAAGPERERPASSWARWLGWLWAPHPVRVRPGSDVTHG